MPGTGARETSAPIGSVPGVAVITDCVGSGVTARVVADMDEAA